MRLRIIIGLCLIIGLHHVYCQRNQQNTAQVDPSSDNYLDLVANSVTNLAQKISRAIASPKSKTEIFSPVSIAGALSLLLLGSSGTTRDELTKLMGFDNQQINFGDIHKSFGKLFRELVSPEPNLNYTVPWRLTDKCNNFDDDEEDEPQGSSGGRGKRDAGTHQISVANGVFVDASFQLGIRYERLAKCLYNGQVQRQNLVNDPNGSARFINQWAQGATNGKVREIVTAEQVSSIPLVLASALYFKGKWETAFVATDTKPRAFYVDGRDRPAVNVPAMATSGCFPYIDVTNDLDAKIVGLPYLDGNSTMYLIVPNNSDRSKLRALQERSNLQQLIYYINQMQVKTGSIVMPKMKLESTISLKQILNNLGVTSIFNPSSSDLSDITGTDKNDERDLERTSVCDVGSSKRKTSQRPVTTNNNAFSPTTQNLNTQRPSTESYQTSSVRQPQTVSISVSDEDCISIRNCYFYDRLCHCPVHAPDFAPQECSPQPFFISSNCNQRKLLLNDQTICFPYYYHHDPSGNCNSQECVRFAGNCFCCNNSRTQSQPTTSSTTKPTQSSAGQTFDFANRFGEPDPIPARIPVINSPPYATQNIQPARQKCSFIEVCDRISKVCKTYRSCVDIGRSLGRQKRQAGGNPLYVGDVVHKVSLDVNEDGTEGGAVTAIVIDRISSSFTLRVDGPFLILLRNDQTKLPLFYGPVYDPRYN